MGIFSMKIYIVVTDVVNDVTYSRKSVNTRVVIRFYDMTLSTGKQRRHMIKLFIKYLDRHFSLNIASEKGMEVYGS